MNLLTAEISRKREEMRSVRGQNEQKYVKQRDLEEKREKAYYEEKERIDNEKEEQRKKKRELVIQEEEKRVLFKKRYEESRLEKKNEGKMKGLTEEEVIKKFREKKQPICLFGETFEEKKERLIHLEYIEEQKRKQEEMIGKVELEGKGVELKEEIEILRKEAEKDESVLNINLNELKNNPENLYKKILVYFEILIDLWRKTLDERPDEIKESKQGKSVSANQQQSQKDLQVFFNLLKKKSMKSDILEGVSKITYHCQRREYIKANDAYLQLSIGNAAWPIGVTMVGIHERSAREKLHTGQTGHVLNDEATRKWLQAIKRLLTFIQSVKPPDDRNQLMG
ncbi:hypothetical protein T552_01563 [Pneumocystis carinii B80]|uniref:Pre-mRNA-splicing factor 18 n=1 Tax=Pneumocystis carinii (strain B80) TaxID=1408658 RepID=A0A0W4ZKN2_PNEC8|nr:hypothetical protein T552_01563 [Pneumocystis carinii B80]KTW28935.1 hypothetical protein T552_01563 [Pneumocystis carinii B80]